MRQKLSVRLPYCI